MGKHLCKITALFFIFLSCQTMAEPVVSIVASGATKVSVPPNSLAAIYYTVTNNTSRDITLELEPLRGITQSTTGDPHMCKQPISLGPHGYCLLTLIANGSDLPNRPVTGLRLSRKTNQSKIYSTPPEGQDLYVTKASPVPGLAIISGDPIRLHGFITNQTSPVTKVLIIQNTSTTLTTNSIQVALTSVEGSLPSDVTVDATNCNPVGGLLPGQTCIINFTPATESGLPVATEYFDVIISADNSSMNQTTAHLTLNPPVPVTYSSIDYGNGPQVIPFPSGSGSLQLTLTNISSETQTLHFSPPENWNNVSYTGCTSPLAPAQSPSSSCVLEFISNRPNYAGIFTITATSSDTSVKIPVSIAFADPDGNLVYSVKDSSYTAVNTHPSYLQWCPPGDNPCNQTTTHADNLYNGIANTTAITSTFGENDPNYAASFCANLGANYYLPAICELGDSLQSAGCNPNTDNIYSNLVRFGFLTNFNGPFWSSTEVQAGAGWLEFFYGPHFSYQYQYVTDFYANVACVTNIA